MATSAHSSAMIVWFVTSRSINERYSSNFKDWPRSNRPQRESLYSYDYDADFPPPATSARAVGGGHVQMRCRSPYTLSMRLTGHQYLSPLGPAGKHPSARG